jgi:Transglycosylase SLT domain
VLIGIILGILIDIALQRSTIIYVAEAKETVAPIPVMIEVKIDWTRERIEEEIRTVFHENPNTAVAVAKCESGLDADVQSGHTLSYGREQSFGIFQIHARDHQSTAVRLGLESYRTDPGDNIAMARHIYDNRLAHGGYAFQDWSCYKNGGYKKYL